MSYFVYILKSIEYDKTYVGITNILERRVAEHNSGKTIYTKKYLPWKLIYNEELSSRLEARAREKYFKSAAGRRKIKLILNNITPP